jgi:hypothetical protein
MAWIISLPFDMFFTTNIWRSIVSSVTLQKMCCYGHSHKTRASYILVCNALCIHGNKMAHTKNLYINNIYSLAAGKIVFKQVYLIEFYVPVTVHPKNFFIIKPTRCTNFTDLFWHETLHVSDSSSVHHQEFIHSTLSNGICHTSL